MYNDKSGWFETVLNLFIHAKTKLVSETYDGTCMKEGNRLQTKLKEEKF